MQDILRKLHELLARHRKLQDDVDLENILEILDQTSVWIAGVDPSSFDFKNPVYEQDLLKKLDLPFLPDLLTDNEGKTFFAAFTAPEKAPGKLVEPFKWIEIPFLKLCYFAAHTGITTEVILDPFTDCLQLPVSLVLQYSEQYAKAHPDLS